MSILVGPASRLMCQGITGRSGLFHSIKSREAGTRIVGGTSPGKGGNLVEGFPVFDTAAQCVHETGADVSVIFVPPPAAKSAIMEAVDAGIRLVVVITEGIPVFDMLTAREYAAGRGVLILGPNTPGLLVPGLFRAGVASAGIFTPGGTGIVSRSGTLAYEAVLQTTEAGVGQSAMAGIGGDMVTGLSFVDIIRMFEADEGTDRILMIGEIGGSGEEAAAEYIREHVKKPIAAYIAGMHVPERRRMGHAGAISGGGEGSARSKVEALEAAGVRIIRSPGKIGETVRGLC